METNEPKKDMAALADDILADFWRVVELIEIHGLKNIHEPYIKHLRGKNGIARAAYVASREY